MNKRLQRNISHYVNRCEWNHLQVWLKEERRQIGLVWPPIQPPTHHTYWPKKFMLCSRSSPGLILKHYLSPLFIVLNHRSCCIRKVKVMRPEKLLFSLERNRCVFEVSFIGTTPHQTPISPHWFLTASRRSLLLRLLWMSVPWKYLPPPNANWLILIIHTLLFLFSSSFVPLFHGWHQLHAVNFEYFLFSCKSRNAVSAEAISCTDLKWWCHRRKMVWLSKSKKIKREIKGADFRGTCTTTAK